MTIPHKYDRETSNADGPGISEYRTDAKTMPSSVGISDLDLERLSNALLGKSTGAEASDRIHSSDASGMAPDHTFSTEKAFEYLTTSLDHRRNGTGNSDDPIDKEIEECLEGLVQNRERMKINGKDHDRRHSTLPASESSVTELEREINAERKEKKHLVKKVRHLKRALEKLNRENTLLLEKCGMAPVPDDAGAAHQKCHEALRNVTERANVTIIRMAERNADLTAENEYLRGRISDMLTGSPIRRTCRSEVNLRHHSSRQDIRGCGASRRQQLLERDSHDGWKNLEYPWRHSDSSMHTSNKARPSSGSLLSTTRYYGRARSSQRGSGSYLTPSTALKEQSRWPRVSDTTKPGRHSTAASTPFSRTEILENELRYANRVTRRAQEMAYDKLR